jgi:hypothetical protein
MTVQYDDNCTSQGEVYESVKRFKVRRMSIDDVRLRFRFISVSGTTENSLLIKLYIILVSHSWNCDE